MVPREPVVPKLSGGIMRAAKKTKTNRERLSELVSRIAEIVEDSQREVERTADERDRAIVESHSRSVGADLSGDPITPEGLSEILDYKDDGHHMWRARNGRLAFWVTVDGTWGLSFDATYGGRIGSYRKLKTITEVKVLIELLGVMTYQQLRARENY